jgi:hypothetical protein
MSSFTDAYETSILNHVFRNSALTSPASVWLALFSVAPTESAAGTELTGNGYARKQITFAAPSGGAVANSADIVFGPATGGGWSAAIAVGIFDASTAGTLIAYKTITSVTVALGEELKFPATTGLTVSLD